MGLFRLLFYVVAGYLAYIVFKRVTKPDARRTVPMEDERIGRLVQDPNCEMYVDRNDALRRNIGGNDMYFCSKECADAYAAKQRGA